MSDKSLNATEGGLPSHAAAARTDVSVILPTFNEKDNIVPLVEKLRSLFRARHRVYEIIVVDDSSPDGTGSTVVQAFADDPGIRLITRRKNPGSPIRSVKA